MHILNYIIRERMDKLLNNKTSANVLRAEYVYNFKLDFFFRKEKLIKLFQSVIFVVRVYRGSVLDGVCTSTLYDCL